MPGQARKITLIYPFGLNEIKYHLLKSHLTLTTQQVGARNTKGNVMRIMHCNCTNKLSYFKVLNTKL